jgi:hypothetical protein
MFKPDSGSPSEVKNLTYQSNKAQRTDLTHFSKGQLRKEIDLLYLEMELMERKHKEGMEIIMNGKSQLKIKELETRNHFLENDNRKLRTELIARRLESINKYKETDQPFMEIAS